MFKPKRWMAWTALAGLSAGCGPQPQPAVPQGPVLIYRLQQIKPAWGGPPANFGPPVDNAWNADPPRRNSGQGGHGGSGWGRHYPWRGPGQPPSWYGHVERHVENSYVLVGDFYYPYYYEDGNIYPVYSMPYIFSDDDLLPRYGELPPFGPVKLQPSEARTLRRQRGHHR